MKILIVTQYFYPENFKSNDLAFELVKRGHTVDALVGIPNYPKGVYYKGYGIFKKRKEIIEGVNVYRCLQFPRGTKSNIRLAINYLSYSFFASIWVLCYLGLMKKYDAIIVFAPSPIIQAIPAILLRKMRRTLLFLWIQDIWPDAMMSGGGVRNEKILCGVNYLVKLIYRSCDILLISSKRFSESILSKGAFQNKIVYYPNWSDDMKKKKGNEPNISFPKGYKIVFAGNLGRSQDLPAVMKVVLLLSDIKEIKWIFVGDGSQKKWLHDFVSENKLEDNVSILGQYPPSCMPTIYEKADALFLSLRSDFEHLKMVVPSKLQSYMSAGKPILGMIDGGAADIINEAHCGYVVSAGDYQKMADLIRNTVINNVEAFKVLGDNGRIYYESNFTKQTSIDHLCYILNKKIKNK